MKHNDGLKDRLTQNLQRFSPNAHAGEDLKRAAVTIVVAPDDDKATFLLTRRAPRLSSHGGQWALPGGRLDAGETVIDAALRELEEEVGIAPQDTDLLGILDEYPTRSGYLIAPVILWATKPLVTKLNPSEVASIHYIPLAELDRPDSVEFLSIPESARPVIRINFLDNNVHAPTAALIHQFHEVAIHGRQTRVSHLEQPVWAWK
ncbi:MAG: CoA pyrophosphatase [Parvibaculum sp.]